MTALKNIEKAELTKLLKDPEVLLIEGQDLSHLNLGNINFSGKTFKDCDISHTNFGCCEELPTLDNCKSDNEKATDVMVLKAKNVTLTILSMIRGNNPYYVINGKEYVPLAPESAMVAQARRLASVIK